jgi:hypothetical protein
MGHIFLSYAREDRTCAECLARVLEGAGHSIWWDRHIDSGEEFAAEIEAQLDKADAVLVAWSKHSVKSRWVRDEAAVGGDTGRLVPVSIDGSLPPMGFRQFHTLDLAAWKGGKRDPRTAHLLSAVNRRLQPKGPAAHVPEKQIERLPRMPAHRSMWLAAALVLAVAVGAFVVSRMGEAPASAPTIALLPFTADSSDGDARKLASAMHDAVAHTLSQGAFGVSTLAAQPRSGPPPADFLISGQVTSTPDKFVTTVRMEETAHRFVVFSHHFEAPRGQAWELPQRVGAQVAAQISWTAPLIAIESKHRSDPAVAAALLQGGAAGLQGIGELEDYEKARRLAAKAPNSPLAQNGLAFNTAFALEQLPRASRKSAVALARRAADRTVELAPEFSEGRIPWCLLRSEVRRIECEDRLRAGMEIDPDGPFANFFLASLVLNPVGRNAEALELARLSLAHDPYMPYKIALTLRLLEASGRTGEAANLYRQAIRWWPDNEAIAWFRRTGMAQRGDFAAVQRFDAGADKQSKPSPVLSAVNRASLPALRKACAAAEQFEGVVCMIGFARLGDLNTAFAFADKLYPRRVGRHPSEEDKIFLDQPGPTGVVYLTGPAAAPLRRDPRYLALAERIGLLAYWRSGRLPDFCRGKPEPICARIRRG